MFKLRGNSGGAYYSSVGFGAYDPGSSLEGSRFQLSGLGLQGYRRLEDFACGLSGCFLKPEIQPLLNQFIQSF